jgi:hypothetical protein
LQIAVAVAAPTGGDPSREALGLPSKERLDPDAQGLPPLIREDRRVQRGGLRKVLVPVRAHRGKSAQAIDLATGRGVRVKGGNDPA